MIRDECCDGYEPWWVEQVVLARREAAGRRRDRVLTNAVGYALVIGAMLWASLRDLM